MGIEIKCSSEMATSRAPAKVEVYENGKLVAEVVATIIQQQGADGGFYDVVKLAQTTQCICTRT